jgi:hypothetical protein
MYQNPEFILLKYTLTADDLLAFHRYWHYQLSGGAIRRRRVGYTWSAMFLGLGFVLWRLSGEPVIAAALVLLAIVAVFRFPRAYDRQVNAQLRKSNALISAIFGEHQLTINERGFQDVGPGGESLMFWKVLAEVRVHGEHLFIRFGTGHAFIINSKSYSSPVPFSELPAAIEKLRPATSK